MRVIGYGDVDFESLGYYVGIPDDWLGAPRVDPAIIPRPGNYATFGQSTVGEMTVPVVFGYTGSDPIEQAETRLLRLLNPVDTESVRLLRIEDNDGNRVSVRAKLRISSSRGTDDVNTFAAQFVAVQPFFDADVSSSATKTFASALDQAMAVTVLGEYPVQPTIRVQPTVQRSTKTADVGWSLRQRYTVTNPGPRAMVNYAILIPLGNTATLVSGGKALASGNDLRVVLQGQEVSRALKGWNTASSGAWVIVPNLAVGATLTYDILYGNASAGSPPVLAWSELAPELPPIDLANSSNAQHIYLVDRTVGNAGKGGWYIDDDDAQPRVVDTAGPPCAWQPVRTYVNFDDSEQELYSTYTASGTKYQARFQAKRGRNGTIVSQQRNIADGVTLRNPLGISSVQCDLRWQNDGISATSSTPIGKLVILTRNAPGQTWQELYSNAALQATEATIATATYTPAAAVGELAFAVWPNSGAAISSAARNDRFISAAWYTTLVVNIASGGLSIVQTEAETAVYEVASRISVGGGAERVAPYRGLKLGNADSQSGRGTPRLTVALNQWVVVNTKARTAEVWNSGLTAKAADIPTAAYVAVEGYWNGSASAERVATDWLPLRPSYSLLSNPDFAADATGWAYGAVTSGVVTAPISRSATAGSDGANGYGVSNVASSSAGANAEIEVIAATYLPVADREGVQVALDSRTASTAQHGRPAIWFYDANQSLLSRSAADAWAQPGDSAWYRRALGVRVPAGAAYYRVGLVHVEESASGVLDLDWDTVRVNDNDIILSDVAMGTLALAAEWVVRRR